ncbi:hypothetical protein F4604DRAFT_1932343 [Suillus subluteus]|nr:hypothetical protein F4604DRAFT_1932343 [Suillus subluteus]
MEMVKTQAPPEWNTPDGLQVTFTVLPLFLSLGLYTTGFFSFFNPSTIVTLPKWHIDMFFDSTSRNTTLRPYSLSPPFYVSSFTILANQVFARLTDMPRVTEGASSVYPVLLLIFTAYGMFEFTMAIAMKPIPGSVGILVPGV